MNSLSRIGQWAWQRVRAGLSGRASATGPGRQVADLLALLRFLALALLVALTGVAGRSDAFSAMVGVTLAAASLSLIIVAAGVRISSMRVAGPVLLGLDAGAGTAGILLGGGMDSPALFYALMPALTAGLLLHRRLAVVLALTCALAVVVGHTLLAGSLAGLAWIMESNYLSLVPVYVLVALGVALLPFFANLNLRYQQEQLARREEQRMLRAELHDKLAQSLSALTLGLRQLARMGEQGAPSSGAVGELVEVSERSYAELRELLDLLEAGSWQPSSLGTLGRLVEGWSALSRIPVRVSAPPGDMGLAPEAMIALLGIVREALNNVGKHAGAREVRIEVVREQDGVSLVVRDDGRGFAPDRPAGHGRRIMADRAASVGATLAVESKPGAGTSVRVRFPRTRER
jgi:signal transduction histidine kinase